MKHKQPHQKKKKIKKGRRKRKRKSESARITESAVSIYGAEGRRGGRRVAAARGSVVWGSSRGSPWRRRSASFPQAGGSARLPGPWRAPAGPRSRLAGPAGSPPPPRCRSPSRRLAAELGCPSRTVVADRNTSWNVTVATMMIEEWICCGKRRDLLDWQGLLADRNNGCWGLIWTVQRWEFYSATTSSFPDH